MKSKYITPEDFKEYFGIDLENTLKSDDNPSLTANAFLYRIETRMAVDLDCNFNKNIEKEFPNFTDYQKKHYKLALLEQAMYVLRNGDISVDSGYDINEGVKETRSKLNNIIYSQNAINNLILCGLWCRKIKNRSRGGLDGWWLR